jgi:hypothetical protein
MPSKKKFTSVGGVGARPIALHNKISTQGPRVLAPAPPAPPAPPATAQEVKLFDTASFGNTLKGFSGYPDKRLESNHWLALIAAAARWNIFVSFHPDWPNMIKTKYKEEFGKDWKGFELVGINYSYVNGIAAAGTVKLKGTKFPYGFVINIDKHTLQNGFIDNNGAQNKFTQTNIEHVFAHELGHVLGLCSRHNPESAVYLPSIPNLPGFPTYYEPTHRVIREPEFPETYIEHIKLVQSAKARLTGGGPTFVVLTDDSKHWMNETVSSMVYAYDPLTNRYRNIGRRNFNNFSNELMVPTFSSVYDNENGYFISTKSIKYLTEIRVDGRQMYVEKNPGKSEVSEVIKYGTASNPIYILLGTVGVAVSGPKSIIVEPQVAIDATDATDATDAICNIIYPDGHVDDCDDDEIMRIIRNHEKIMNDPGSMKFKCNS